MVCPQAKWQIFCHFKDGPINIFLYCTFFVIPSLSPVLPQIEVVMPLVTTETIETKNFLP